MPTFLYSAENRVGKKITERVKALNHRHAREILERDGCTSVVFHDSERTAEALDASNLKLSKRLLAGVSLKYSYDTRLRTAIPLLVLPFFSLAPILFVYWGSEFGPLGWTLLTIFGAHSGIQSLRTLSLFRLSEAHVWHREKSVRFWGAVAAFTSKFTTKTIFRWEVAVLRACADARAGKVDKAFARLAAFSNNAAILPRMWLNAVASIFNAARDDYHYAAQMERMIAGGQADAENLAVFALFMLERRRDIGRARELVGRAMNMEACERVSTLIPLVQAAIEVEQQNFPNAEFYLGEAAKKLEPFRNNTFMVGQKSRLKTYLAITLARLGRRDEARRLFAAARPYLESVNERDLLEKGDEVCA